MKRRLFFILSAIIALIMVGCNYRNQDGSYDTSKNPAMTIVVINSCEYISAYYRLAHKGNCRLCKERDSIKWEKRKKELEELVIKLKKK